MALPPRKAGGLYGGIQFSSSNAVAPATAADPAPEYETPADAAVSTLTSSASIPSASTTIVGTASESTKIQEPVNDGGAAASAGKATAGIQIR